jgi:hypothetical protein
MFPRAMVILFVSMSLAWCVADVNSQPTTRTDPGSNEAVVEALKESYCNLNYELFVSLFVNETEHGVPYTFLLDRPNEKGETQWGLTQEMRIHRRMFRPETIPKNDKPLPRDLWITSIELELVRIGGLFRERYDLYRSDQKLEGLDRHRWRAMSAEYAYSMLIHTQGGKKLCASGQATFVVIEDLANWDQEEPTFLIYRWEDRRTPIETATRISR